MTTLEQVTQMKAQGFPDEEIVNNLQQQGISPREIQDALNQAQIKQAVSDEDMAMQAPEVPNPYAPQTQEIGEQYAPQQNYPMNQGGGQEYYAQSPESNYASGNTTETTIEIAEQVFEEKIQKIQKKTDEISEFKTLSEVKLKNIDERLKRIESMFDRLQIEILRKVGAFGTGIETAKKEIAMIEDSFRKIKRPIKKRATRKKKK